MSPLSWNGFAGFIRPSCARASKKDELGLRAHHRIRKITGIARDAVPVVVRLNKGSRLRAHFFALVRMRQEIADGRDDRRQICRRDNYSSDAVADRRAHTTGIAGDAW